MAAFQIHEDIENIHPRFFAKKYTNEVDKKIKKFGENNAVSGQQSHKHGGLKEIKSSKLPVINGKVGRGLCKKTKIVIEDIKEESEFEDIKSTLVVDSFLNIEDKENSEPNTIVAVKEYCPLSILHKQYGEDIYKYLRNLEENGPRPKPTYMLKQFDLNWNSRAILIDWLISISDEYELSHETLHLSVNYIDRFLSSISVVRSKFQLVGAAAMRLASKMEEYQAFDTKEWSYLTGDSFTPKQIIKMEQIILKVLGFNLKSPTVCDFIQHLSSEYKLDEKTVHFALYISELVLVEGEDYLHQFPSKLAAASIALARINFCKPNPWPEKLKKASGYTLKELSPVVQKQFKTLEESPLKEQRAIATKYRSPKFNQVALMKPRKLSLEYLENCARE